MMEQQDLSLIRETQLVVVVKLEGNDMHFEELMVVVTVEKESAFVDQVVKAIVDTKEDCTENDGCSGKTVCDDSLQPRKVDSDTIHASHGLHEYVPHVG
ncbi:hypothetical protein Tco_1340961 [Tanacetum coccineum]